MSGSLLLFSSIIIFLIAYYTYGKYLDISFGIDKNKTTPAIANKDGVDYIPAKLPVLFGHHFASIAGAGPIVGPVLGACFGWGPAVIWILLGSVFIGAVHDYAALFISVRNKGLSIGSVVEDALGKNGRLVFLLFCFACLILVVAIFAIFVARTFTASPEVASSSLLFIALSPLFAVVTNKFKLSLLPATIIFLPLIIMAIICGSIFPLNLMQFFSLTVEQVRIIWMLILFLYVFAASVLPVWILLQPRDYLNSYLLYGMLFIGLAGVFITSPELQFPFFRGFSVITPNKVKWDIFPLIFVTIACGACSGFHSLVASGTSSKQIASEKHIRPVGYGAMLLEGVLAVLALVSVTSFNSTMYNDLLSSKGPVNAFASGLANLLVVLGISLKKGEVFISLTISAFMLTTLDTATRLTRFTLQEICRSGVKKNKISEFFSNRYAATFVVIVLAGYLSISGDAFKIWPVFGASNQLLVAITLLVIAVINKRECKKWLILFIPFLFMLLITIWALINLAIEYLSQSNYLIGISSIVLIGSSFFLVYISSLKLFAKNN